MSKLEAVRSPSAPASGVGRPASLAAYIDDNYSQDGCTRNSRRLEFLRGGLQRLPAIVSKTVRVFISSTFSDMVVERNALMEHVYPRLKDYCRQYGLEFQVVDMRWGVREEAQDDHMTSVLCMKAIHDCQRVSMATTFVAMFGQKYGYRPFPVSIATKEFDALREELIKRHRDVTLLDQWFQADENVVPPVYSLVPISSKLPNYVNSKQPDLQEQDRELWWETFQSLQELLREGATVCYQQGKIREKEREKYFISVTDDEIRHGIQYDSDTGRQICFVRTITDLMQHIEHEEAPKYIDMADKEKRIIDTEAQALLRVLREEQLPNWVSSEQIHTLKVKWSKAGGIDLYECQDYIIELCECFYSSLCGQIAERVEHQNSIAEDQLAREVLQHATMARKLIDIFQGREDILEQVQTYLGHEQDHPLVIHGESGSGKTSLMAMVAGNTPHWMSHQSPTVILRFLGTSPQSSGIFQLLLSVCNQIAECYDVPLPDIGNDFSRLVALFFDLLQFGTYEEPLVVVLDSLDQLSSNHSPNRLLWLPWKLPRYAYVIVSTLPEHKLLARLRTLVPNESNFIRVPALGQVLSKEIVMRWLSLSKRTLTAAQSKIVEKALAQCSLPLYTKLVYEEVHRWKSSWLPSSTKLETTVKGLINTLLDRMEKVHGRILVSHALAYVTASRSGLTDAEIEDVLSMDDDVLDDVFTFWVPPIRRIPPLLWTRIRGDLRHYLVEREADKMTVLSWYHRQFQVSVRERYLTDRNFRIRTHSALADYFMGLWGGGKKKPFRYSELLTDKLHLKSREGEADRKMPTQPLKWKMKHGGVTKTRYNLRKLTELPFHLYRAERYHELWQEVLYNYRWLHAKLKATSVVEVLADAMLVHKAFKNHRLGLLISALRVAGSSLRQLPNALASELLGRLKQSTGQNEHLDSFLAQCRTEGLEDCALLPAFPCFEASLEAVVFCLEGHRRPPVRLLFSHDSHRLYSVATDCTISVWCMHTGEQYNCIDIPAKTVSTDCKLELDGRGMLVLENTTEDSPLFVFDASCGTLESSFNSRPPGFTHSTIFGSRYVVREGTVVDLEKNCTLKTLQCLSERGSFVTVAITPNEKRLMVAMAQQTSLVDITTEKVICKIPNSHIPSQIRITNDSRRAVLAYSLTCKVCLYNINIASSNLGKKIKELDFQSLIPDFNIKTLSNVVQEVTDIKISVDNTKLLVNVQGLELFVVVLKDSDLGTPTRLDMDAFYSQDWQVNAADFSYDASLVVGIVNCQLCVWQSDKGSQLASVNLPGSDEDQFELALAGNCLLAATSCSSDLSIRVWDIEKLVETCGPGVHVYRNPVDYIEIIAFQAIAFIKTYRRLNSRNGYQYLDYFGIDAWNLSTNQRSTFLPFNKYGQLATMKASMDGHFMVLVTENKATSHIFLLDLRKDRILAHLNQSGCTAVHISPDCRHLLTEANDTKLWNLKTGELMKTFTSCQSCTFTTESKFALLIHETKRLLIFNLETRDIKPLPLRKLCATRVTAVPKCAGLAMVTGFGAVTGVRHASRVEMWDFVREERICRIDNVGANGMVDFSKDGKLGVDSRLQVFSLTTGKLVCKPKFVDCQERCHVRLTDDGAYMLWADREPADCIRVMHVASGSVVAEVSTHARVTALELANHGYLVLVGCEDGHLLTFRLYRVIQDDVEPVESSSPELPSPPVRKLLRQHNVMDEDDVMFLESLDSNVNAHSGSLTEFLEDSDKTEFKSGNERSDSPMPRNTSQSNLNDSGHSSPKSRRGSKGSILDGLIFGGTFPRRTSKSDVLEDVMATSPRSHKDSRSSLMDESTMANAKLRKGSRPNFIEFSMALRTKLNRSNPNLKTCEPPVTPPVDQMDKNANFRTIKNLECRRTPPTKPRLRFQKSISDPNISSSLPGCKLNASNITTSPTYLSTNPFSRTQRQRSGISDCSHEECTLGPEHLRKLDVLYQRTIETVRPEDMPSLGEATQQKLRAKAEFVYSISSIRHSESSPSSHKQSCTLM